MQSNNLNLNEKQLGRETSRRSGLELLRIVAMVAIISYHFRMQTPLQEAVGSVENRFLINLLGCFGRSGVNVFVMLGAWFLTERPFNSQRMIRLYLACFFYTVCGTAIALWTWPLTDQTENIKAMLRALLPLSGSPLWFVSDYLALLFLSPYLNMLARQLPYEKYTFLTKVLLLVYVVVPVVENMVPGINTHEWFILYKDFIWLIVLYLLVAFVKLHYREQLEMLPPHYLLVPCLLVAVAFNAIVAVCPNDSSFMVSKFLKFTDYLFHALNSPFCLVMAFGAFLWFRRLDFSSRLVNWIAQGVLGIYILHQVPVLVPHIWGFFRIEQWNDTWCFVVKEILTVLAIFICCLGIDTVRRVLMRPVLRSSFIEKLSAAWNARMPN